MIKASVVWSRNEVPPGLEKNMPRGMGVEFIKISNEEWNFISSFISDLDFALFLQSAASIEVENRSLEKPLVEEQK